MLLTFVNLFAAIFISYSLFLFHCLISIFTVRVNLQQFSLLYCFYITEYNNNNFFLEIKIEIIEKLLFIKSEIKANIYIFSFYYKHNFLK